jgi:hypothetical protein
MSGKAIDPYNRPASELRKTSPDDARIVGIVEGPLESGQYNPENQPSRVPSEDVKAGLLALTQAVAKTTSDEEPDEADSDDEKKKSISDGYRIEDVRETSYSFTPMDNPMVREAVEKRCKDIDIAQVIMTGLVEQDIPIVENKLVIRVRSLRPRDTDWLLDRSADLSPVLRGTLQVYGSMAFQLLSINGTRLPDALKGDGRKRVVDEKKFKKKYEQLLDMNEAFLNILAINLKWFNLRIESLFWDDYRELKNG